MRNRLKRLQYRPGTLDGFIVGTGLALDAPTSPWQAEVSIGFLLAGLVVSTAALEDDRTRRRATGPASAVQLRGDAAQTHPRLM
ncbi:hypothetical protein GCM10019016_080160 [Streptomyces prasinosporus]|uniref:Uncharacterized protein n=1 Tax=Streptomyces prasinosporus TaxID=68256 RepID=A0ABP6U0N9_9ACTN|nr:hypothetical protein GCM10010332_50370 [Streptomyces albogriseolus]